MHASYCEIDDFIPHVLFHKTWNEFKKSKKLHFINYKEMERQNAEMWYTIEVAPLVLKTKIVNI